MLKEAELPASSKPAVRESASAVERRRMQEWLETRIEAAKKEPATEIVTITPVLAKLLLDRNEDNRPIRQANLERVKRDLESGHFEFNGQPVVLSKEGLLNDGQHRMFAIIDTGRPIRCPIIFGATRESRFTLDQGAPRTIGNYLAMNKLTNTNALAALAANVWQYLGHGRLSSNGNSKPTRGEALLTVSHYKDLPDVLAFVARNDVKLIASPSLLAFCYWAIARQSGLAAASEFIDKLITGINLNAGDPILYCRKRLMELKGNGGAKPNEKAEIIFRAWNFFRRGENVVRIPLQDGPLPKLEK